MSDLTLGRWIRDRARTTPGRVAIDCLGVETTYYDPLIGAGIADLIRPNTRIIFTESPGSQ